MGDIDNKLVVGDVLPEHLLNGWVTVQDFMDASEKTDPGSERNDKTGSGILMGIIRDVAVLLGGGLVLLVILWWLIKVGTLMGYLGY